jgi:hypothetical protein
MRPRPGFPESDNPPFADTQLLISLLGILIFPHERTPNTLCELLDGYEALLDEIIFRRRRRRQP